MPSFLQVFLPLKATAVDQCVSTSPFYALCFPQDRAAQEHNPSFIYSWSISHIWSHEFYCLGHLGNQGIWEFLSYFWVQFCTANVLTIKAMELTMSQFHPSVYGHFTIVSMSHMPWLPKWPKQENSCDQMWLIDQLYIKLGLCSWAARSWGKHKA